MAEPGTSAQADILALPSSGELLGYTPEQLDRSLEVNLRAPVMLTRLLVPRMLESGRGHVARAAVSSAGPDRSPSTSQDDAAASRAISAAPQSALNCSTAYAPSVCRSTRCAPGLIAQPCTRKRANA